jgi:hypothetical protein
MSEKFNTVPKDDDTKIISELECKLGELDVLYQKWIWAGIVSESFIFAGNDVAEMDDDALEKFVRTSPLVKPESKVLIQRSSSGFVFANFNAIAAEDL